MKRASLLILAAIAAGALGLPAEAQTIDRNGYYQVSARELSTTAPTAEAPRLRAEPLVGRASATYERMVPRTVSPRVEIREPAPRTVDLDRLHTTVSPATPLVPRTAGEAAWGNEIQPMGTTRYYPGAATYVSPFERARYDTWDRGGDRDYGYRHGYGYGDNAMQWRTRYHRAYPSAWAGRYWQAGPVLTYRYGHWPRSALFSRYYGCTSRPTWWGGGLNVRIVVK